MSDAGSLAALICGREYSAASHLGITCPQMAHLREFFFFFSLHVGQICSNVNEAVDHFPEQRLLNASEINQEKAGNGPNFNHALNTPPPPPSAFLFFFPLRD